MALAGRDATLDFGHPAAALELALDRRRREVGLHVEDAARDVVARAALDDGVVGDDDAADGYAVPDMGVGHEVRADDALVARAVGDLLPYRLRGALVEGLGEEGVRLHLHAPDLREHVVVGGDLLNCVLEQHRICARTNVCVPIARMCHAKPTDTTTTRSAFCPRGRRGLDGTYRAAQELQARG